MSDPTLQLTLTLDGGPGASAEDLEDLSRRLRDDLLELDVETVETARKQAPAGSKSPLGIDWTTLFVTLAASGGVLTTLITAVQAQMSRTQGGSVTLKLGDDELTLGPGPYSEEQKRMIALWGSRHKGFVLSNE